jgi:hypothetical protein
MVYLLDRSGFELGRDFCAAQVFRSVTSMAGNGIVFQDGRIESDGSRGNAARAPGFATLPRAAICVLQDHFAHSETCHGRSRGFLTFLRPSMIPASTRLCARIAAKTRERTRQRHRYGQSKTQKGNKHGRGIMHSTQGKCQRRLP